MLRTLFIFFILSVTIFSQDIDPIFFISNPQEVIILNNETYIRDDAPMSAFRAQELLSNFSMGDTLVIMALTAGSLGFQGYDFVKLSTNKPYLVIYERNEIAILMYSKENYLYNKFRRAFSILSDNKIIKLQYGYEFVVLTAEYVYGEKI